MTNSDIAFYSLLQPDIYVVISIYLTIYGGLALVCLESLKYEKCKWKIVVVEQQPNIQDT